MTSPWRSPATRCQPTGVSAQPLSNTGASLLLAMRPRAPLVAWLLKSRNGVIAMLRRAFLKSSAICAFFGLTSFGNGQVRFQRNDDENFKINNTNPFPLYVTITGDNGDGRRRTTQYTFAARQEQQALLGAEGAGYEPFDITVVANGTVTSMRNVPLCQMMKLCKASGGRSLDFNVPSTMQLPTGGTLRPFQKARSAWRHVVMTF